MMMHSHPTPIIGIAILGLAQESVQLILKHLRLTADQAHVLFFIANSSCLTHSWAWLGKPYC